MGGLKKIANSSSFKNASWSVTEVVIYPLGLILSTPFLLTQLGTENYGIWVLLNSIIFMLQVLNFGLNETTVKFVSAYRVGKDNAQINILLSHLLQLILLSAGFVALISLATYVFVPKMEWFGISGVNVQLFSKLLPLVFAIAALKLLEQFLISVFKGFERYDRASIVGLIGKLSVLVANVILVGFGFSLKEMFISNLILVLLVLLWEFRIAHRLIPDFNMKWGLRYSLLSRLFEFSGWSFLFQLAVNVSAQLDKFIVAIFIGPTTLAYYSLGVMVYTQLHNVASSGAQWLFPMISKMTELKESVSHLFYIARTGLMSLTMLAVVFLFCTSNWIFPLWLQEENYLLSKPYILGFIGVESFVSITIIPYFFLMGSGRMRLNTLLEVSLKALNIVLMLLGFKLLGTMGLIYGLILAQVLFVPIQNFIIRRRVFGDVLPMGFNDLLILLPALLFMLLLVVEGILGQIGIIVLIFAAMYWIFMRQVDKGDLRKILNSDNSH